ncbi:MAG: TolC family protein [Gammaproteobacteria bacterium]
MNLYQLFFIRDCLLGILLSILPFAYNPAVADDFTFSQAWQLVLQNNDGLVASEANKEEAGFLQQAAKDMYFPQINISGGYTRLNDDIKLAPSQIFDAMPAGDVLKTFFENLVGSSAGGLNSALTTTIADRNVATASLNMVWPIYTGGRINAAQDIVEGKFKESDYLFRIKQQDLFEQLTKYYFGVVLAKQISETRRDAERGLFKHLQNSRKLETQGQIARVERLKAEASHATAKVAQHKSDRNLEIAQLALNSLLKTNINASPINSLFINNDMPVLTSMVNATLNNHPGLGVLESKRIQAQGFIEVKQAAYLPEAFLLGNYNLYEDDTLAAELAPDWLVGIGIKIPIISRSGRSGKLSAAKSTLSKIDHLKAQAIRDLSLLVEKTWREAQVAQEEYNGLTPSLELANENIRLRTIAFAQGLSTSLEVVDAELFLVNVKTQQQVAAYRYVLSLARLLALSNQMTQFTDYQNKGHHE